MAKAKKIVTSSVVILIALILVVSLAIHFFGNSAVKAGIEAVGSKTLGVGVNVNRVDLSILGGRLNMKNFEISNPEGYQSQHFMKMGAADVKLKVSSLLSQTVEIDKMQFDNIVLTLEQKGLTNNLQQILNNLPKSEEKPAEKTPPKEGGKNLHIKDLLINGATVNVNLLVPGKADTLSFDLAPIHMTDIGSDSKVDLAKLIGNVLIAMAEGVAEKGKDILPTEMIGPLTDTLRQTGTQILEQGKDVLKEGSDLGQGIGEAVHGLLKKKEEK